MSAAPAVPPLRRDREANDWYCTPRHVTAALLSAESIVGPVWEPACGDGAISEVLRVAGLQVVSTDLIDRGYGIGGVDFLAERTLRAPAIVTNPPYRRAEEFVRHALELGAQQVVMLLRLAWLEGEARRRRLFAVSPPARVWVLSARPTLWDGTDPNARTTGGAIGYAWYAWQAGHTGAPTVGWLAKGAGADLADRAELEAMLR